MGDFDGKSVIVTGGALGIGEERAPTRLPHPARAKALPVIGNAFAVVEARKELGLASAVAVSRGKGPFVAEETA